jgi:lipopolysaccharide/colanic/teichoic acid biosynthesis glycosyltransferase
MKRALDILLSGLGLFVLSPLLLLVMAILRLTGEGEVFFLQERMGYGNKPFKITKFATMLKSAGRMGSGDYTVENDPRVLPVGRVLRKTKINELPQLWDVFRGKMSLVGPRPQMLRIHALYGPEFDTVLARVRPGITGIGSIVFRDEERILTHAADRDYCYKHQIVPYKAELERWYAEHRTFWLDLWLMFLTIWHVARPQSRLAHKLLPVDLIRSPAAFDGVQPQLAGRAAGIG